jgi:hypothetical protein
MFGAEAALSPRFRTVYILDMPNGLEQYLASRLTSGRVLWVVLEPASADAVLTDRLDDTFWTWLARCYPPPAGASRSTDTASRRESQAAAKHSGTVFLVDPRSRVVLWSTYDRARSEAPDEMDRTAARIANQLKASFTKK